MRLSPRKAKPSPLREAQSAAAEGGGPRRRRHRRRRRALRATRRLNWKRISTERINGLGRRESVLCTYGILDSVIVFMFIVLHLPWDQVMKHSCFLASFPGTQLNRAVH